MSNTLSPRDKEATQMKKRFIRYEEAVKYFDMEEELIIAYARAAGAVYKIGESKGSKVLIRLDVFDEYMEQFRQEPKEMKQSLKEV